MGVQIGNQQIASGFVDVFEPKVFFGPKLVLIMSWPTLIEVLSQSAETTIQPMLDFRKSLINGTLNKAFKRLHYPLEVMLTCVRWYIAYPLSLRHAEEVIAKSAVFSLTTPPCIAG